ncbi:MAG: hypothetical protein E4H13_06560 [Calditrichales bacterium]|nr:MAG: hypothetical protein E4H13_06560 [Calditrichales bacterium]
MLKRSIFIGILFVYIVMLTGCAASRTDIVGLYGGEQKFTKKQRVKALFDFFYYTKQTGRDAISKSRSYSGVSGFNDIFKESIKELTNISEFETFYNLSDHIDDPEIRKQKEDKIERSDYVIKLEFLQENSFSKHVLGAIVSICSFDLIPIGYTWDYTFTATIIKKGEGIIGKYSRQASVTNWFQIALIVLYPFHPEEAKTEQVYLESLTNLFKQIEDENVLN